MNVRWSRGRGVMIYLSRLIVSVGRYQSLSDVSLLCNHNNLIVIVVNESLYYIIICIENVRAIHFSNL